MFVFAEELCWARNAERQISWMRLDYLESVLKDIEISSTLKSWFSTTYQIVSTITSDSNAIQVTIGKRSVV